MKQQVLKMAKVQITSDGKVFEIEVEEGLSDDEVRQRVISFLEQKKSFPSETRAFPQLELPSENEAE